MRSRAMLGRAETARCCDSWPEPSWSSERFCTLFESRVPAPGPSKMTCRTPAARERRMGLAIVHIVGALAASFAFSLLLFFVGAWEQGRSLKRRMRDASIALGVPATMLETDESFVPRIVQYAAKRYSDELLVNRLSDLCGALRTAWGWLSNLLQIGIIVGVGWLMYFDGAGNAAYMWCVLAVPVFFWLVSAGFSLACLVLTGRYPGEAKLARKSIADTIERRHAAGASQMTWLESR